MSSANRNVLDLVKFGRSFTYFLEEITKLIDEGSPVDIIYLYFQKAFDKKFVERLKIIFNLFRKVKNNGDNNIYKMI